MFRYELMFHDGERFFHSSSMPFAEYVKTIMKDGYVVLHEKRVVLLNSIKEIRVNEPVWEIPRHLFK